MRRVIDQGGAEVKNSAPLFVFLTKALGRGQIPAHPLILSLHLCFGLAVFAMAEGNLGKVGQTNTICAGSGISIVINQNGSL